MSDGRVTHLRAWLRRYWISLRHNVPYWPMMVVNIGLWLVLPPKRYFAVEDLPGVDRLQHEWHVIRAELDDLLTTGDRLPGFEDIDPGQIRLSPDAKWRTFMLRFIGADCEPNRERCPKTAAVLDEVPDLYTAFFSVLEPGAVIPIHAGAIKGVVRVHLPLMVPEGPDCWIEISGERHHWVEGEALIFDDTYPHRVRNDTDQVRVVLFVDIVRPVSRPLLDRFNRWVLRSMTQTRRIANAIDRAETLTA